MKKILLFIALIISCISLKAQTTQQTPYYLVKNGDTVGVVISITQAQKIDNDLQLLSLLQDARVKESTLDSAYVSVIDNYGKEVAELNVKISAMQDIDTTKDSQINNLKQQIIQYQEYKKLADEQYLKQDTLITNYKKQVTKLKIQKDVGLAAGALGILLFIITKL